MTDDLTKAKVYQSADLPKIEPIPAEAGPFVLTRGDLLLGVMRQPSGRVKLNCVVKEKVKWGESLSPEEARWLREALGNLGY